MKTELKAALHTIKIIENQESDNDKTKQTTVLTPQKH